MNKLTKRAHVREGGGPPAPHDRIAAMPHEELVGDGGRGAARIVSDLDAVHEAAHARQRFEYVMAHLTRSQH